jgi:hypothetical protein
MSQMQTDGRRYFIRLRVDSMDREDAWELCRVAVQCGGVETHNGCFVFSDFERWHSAWEQLASRFGAGYLEANCSSPKG